MTSKFTVRTSQLTDLVELGSLSPRTLATFLDASVRAGLDVLVAGDTHTGT